MVAMKTHHCHLLLGSELTASPRLLPFGWPCVCLEAWLPQLGPSKWRSLVGKPAQPIPLTCNGQEGLETELAGTSSEQCCSLRLFLPNPSPVHLSVIPAIALMLLYYFHEKLTVYTWCVQGEVLIGSLHEDRWSMNWARGLDGTSYGIGILGYTSILFCHIFYWTQNWNKGRHRIGRATLNL